MMSMAVGVLWFLIGLIILCGVVYLAIWVIEQFVMATPEKVKQGVWVIILLLALIALLTVVAGGGLGSIKPPFRLGGVAGPAVAALSARSTADLPGLLGGFYAASQ